MVPKLATPDGEPIKVHFHKLSIGVCDAHIELDKVQLELNLQIANLQLKAQPSTSPEVKVKHSSANTKSIAIVNHALAY